MPSYKIPKFQIGYKIGNPSYGFQSTDPYKSTLNFQNSSLTKPIVTPTFDSDFLGFLKKNGLDAQGIKGTEGFFKGQFVKDSTSKNNSLQIGSPKGKNLLPSGNANSPLTPSGNLAGGIGQVAGTLDSLLPATNQNSTTQGINAVTDSLSSAALQSGNPYAMAAGALYKTMSFVDKGLASITNGDTTIEKPATKFDEITQSTLGKILLPGLGYASAITKQTVEGSDKDLGSLVSQGGGYGAADATEEKQYGGWSRLFGKKKVANAKAATQRANTQNILAASAQQVGRKDMQMAQNTVQDVGTRNYFAQKGGIDNSILSAKLGTKINPASLRNIVKKVTKFQKGGTLNVIPEGALHARLNNYEGELGEQVTNKGIPVITVGEGGSIKQHAEIEHSEIIFHKQVTTKLEELFKQYNETTDSVEQNQLAIEAGKFLTSEILENTQDNVGLLNTIK